MVNSHPSKTRVVWHDLVDVNDVKAAITKLKEINPFYKHVDDKSLDSSVREVVEVAATMLEKATDEDVAGLQYYTIRDLNKKLPTTSDIEQYKLINIRRGILWSTDKSSWM